MSLAARARELWIERSARERLLVATAAGLVALAALHALLWAPALAARQRLAVSLPALRAQVDTMRRQEQEIAALRSRVAAAPKIANLAEALRSSLAQAPFAKTVERVESVADDRAQVLAVAEFGAWLLWVHGLQADLGVRVVSCIIAPAGPEGSVRVQAVLAAPSAR